MGGRLFIGNEYKMNSFVAHQATLSDWIWPQHDSQPTSPLSSDLTA
jgi:hypothetical protein